MSAKVFASKNMLSVVFRCEIAPIERIGIESEPIDQIEERRLGQGPSEYSYIKNFVFKILKWDPEESVIALREASPDTLGYPSTSSRSVGFFQSMSTSVFRSFIQELHRIFGGGPCPPPEKVRYSNRFSSFQGNPRHFGL